jgi:hypothetical protein
LSPRKDRPLVTQGISAFHEIANLTRQYRGINGSPFHGPVNYAHNYGPEHERIAQREVCRTVTLSLRVMNAAQSSINLSGQTIGRCSNKLWGKTQESVRLLDSPAVAALGLVERQMGLSREVSLAPERSRLMNLAGGCVNHLSAVPSALRSCHQGPLLWLSWERTELDRIAGCDDLHIAPLRDDGRTHGTPIWIWSVVVNGDLYVRAYHGGNSRWYQAAIRQKAGRVIAAGLEKHVLFEPVNESIDD